MSLVRVQAVSLDRKGAYTERYVTQRYSVPFFAKGGGDFQQKYPLGSGSRVRLEQVHLIIILTIQAALEASALIGCT